MSEQPTVSNKSPDGSNLVSVAVLGVLLLSLGIVGYLFLGRIQGLENAALLINERIDQLELEVRSVSETSAIARSSAEQAEEYARIAAKERVVAEASRDRFEQRASDAEQEVSRAREKAQVVQQELQRFRKEREEEMNRLQKALNKIAETRRTALGLVMNLGSDTIQFDFDKALLKQTNRELLSRIAGVLLTSDGYRVQIYGHTDDVGTEEYNQALSERRAQTVEKYLVQAGIDPEIVTTKGFGKSNPLIPGSTPEARSKNRRVEIGIIDTAVNYQGPVRTQE